jgi:hypothetical protein
LWGRAGGRSDLRGEGCARAESACFSLRSEGYGETPLLDPFPQEPAPGRAQTRLGWGSRCWSGPRRRGSADSSNGAIARRLAERYALPHLDTGLLYRATAAALFAAGHDLADEAAAAHALDPTDFDRREKSRARRIAESGGAACGFPSLEPAAAVAASRTLGLADFDERALRARELERGD